MGPNDPNVLVQQQFNEDDGMQGDEMDNEQAVEQQSDENNNLPAAPEMEQYEPEQSAPVENSPDQIAKEQVEEPVETPNHPIEANVNEKNQESQPEIIA